ncbi:cell wall-binding repeat-containing protein [Clostridium kluyveri]|uniref:cell wall-binding repeat-containing protein n=1 Tax=Clostridium kluyveri TaxID=1534 RepID=UPI00224550CD|nr:cell wall-binding repeat-containing protein [Clostridium kluyveri]UZQ49120.1 cell wall-binding repeat-containing protein [Clostridium kluyveri]
MSKEYFTMYEGQKIKLMPPSQKPQDKPRSQMGLKVSSIKASLPSNYILPSVAAVLLPKNQGQWGSCVAHSNSFAMELTNYKRTGVYTQLSATFIHGNRQIWDNRGIDELTDEDDDLKQDTAIHCALRYGSVLYDTMPGTVSASAAKSTILANKDTFFYQARSNRLAGAINLNSANLDEIKQKIYDGYSVIITMDISGQDTNNRGFYYLDGVFIGSHSLCIVGWDDNHSNADGSVGALIAFNSWTATKSLSQWTVSYEILPSWSHSFIDTDPGIMTDIDLGDISKGALSVTALDNTGTYLRSVFGTNRQRLDSLISLYYPNGRVIDIANMSLEALIAESITLPLKSYVNMGSAGDIKTSIYIGKHLGEHTDGFLLARNDDYVAASCGAALCKQTILTSRPWAQFLTDNVTLDAEIASYHSNYKDDGLQKSFVLAGTGVISSSIVNQISGGATPVRYAGADRYYTAKAIMDIGIFGYCGLIIVNGTDYPDLVCASALSAFMKWPLLVQDASDTLNPAIQAFIDSNVNHVVTGAFIIGGTSLISTSVENQLKSQLYPVTRYSGGANRYETSVQLINQIFASGNADGDSYKNLVIARGDTFANMSSAAQLASQLNAAIILCDGNTLPSGAQTIINNMKANYGNCIYLASPSGTISSSLLSTL